MSVVIVSEHLEADPQHHRPVPLDERAEGCFVTTGQKEVEQLTVGKAHNGACLEKQSKVAAGKATLLIGHESGSLFRLDVRI